MLVNLLNCLFIAVANLMTYTVNLEQSILVNLLNLEKPIASVKSDGGRLINYRLNGDFRSPKKSRKLIWFRSK